MAWIRSEKRGGTHRRVSRAAVVGACMILAAGATTFAVACGGDDPGAGTQSSGTPTATSTVTVDAAYSGPEKDSMTLLAEPEQKSGFTFKVGFLQASAQQGMLVSEQKAFEDKIAELGGQVVAMDAGLDVQRQASQFNNLLAQKVDAVAVVAVYMPALAQALKTAQAAGIPVVTTNGPADTTQGLLPGTSLCTTIGWDYAAYSTVKYVADKMPGAKVAILGLAIPVDPLIYLAKRVKYWSDQMGLQVLGQVDSKDDTPTSNSVAATSLLSKYPDAQVLFMYNDQAAVATASAIKSAGKTGVVIANPNGGMAVTKGIIEDGTMIAAYRDPWEQMGQQMAIAVYDSLTQQGLPLPSFVIPPSQLLTKDNVNSVPLVQ